MKLLIISDIHGSSYYTEKIKEIEAKENPDQIILLGDLYYHGPRNELTQEYNPMKVTGVLNDLKDKIRAVRGNCDAEVDEMISDFKLEPYIEMQVNGKKVFFSHGHVYNMDNISHKDIDIMFYGHFHVGFIEGRMVSFLQILVQFLYLKIIQNIVILFLMRKQLH